MFEIDHKAFRSQNAGRPPQHLIREAVQNSFDENPDNVYIEVRAAKGRGIDLSIIDDGPGFSDVKEIWTIFSSGKRDDPTKRGRFGRGLKELISVCSSAVIRTAGRQISFSWTGKTFKRKIVKVETKGVSIEATIPGWKKSLLPEIQKYLSLFIPPDDTTMIVNEVPNDWLVVEKRFCAFLKTVVYRDDGVPEEKWRTTDVSLLQPLAGQSKWFYEMGIPVEPIADEDGFEWHVDIGQRTPLRPERDMLPRSYVKSVYAAVANEMMNELPTEELTDLWMEEAVGHWEFDRSTHGETYVRRRFGDKAARAVNSDPHDRNVRAAEDGVNVVQTQHLSASVRELVKTSLPSTVDLYPARTVGAVYIPEAEWTDGERRFVSLAKWLADRMKLSEPNITVLDAPESNCMADSSQSATQIRINRSICGGNFFEIPKLSNWVPLIIHELAHRTGNGHGSIFWDEYERLTGEAVQIVADDRDAIARFMSQSAVVDVANLVDAETDF